MKINNVDPQLVALEANAWSGKTRPRQWPIPAAERPKTSISRLTKVFGQAADEPEMIPSGPDEHRQHGRQEGDQQDIRLP